MPMITDKTDEDREPYREPDIENGVWPEHWTKRQKENWIDHGDEQYERLETDEGRYWFRRVWRPKKAREGMMQFDHVKLGTPEDYVSDGVESRLRPMRSLWSDMMRQVTSYGVPKEELDTAVSDIVQARIQMMDDYQRAHLGEQAQRVARAYGLDQ